MRSDRDIQRTPRRPTRRKPEQADAARPEAAPAAPFANIPVSHKPPSGLGEPRNAPWGQREPWPERGPRPDGPGRSARLDHRPERERDPRGRGPGNAPQRSDRGQREGFSADRDRRGGPMERRHSGYGDERMPREPREGRMQTSRAPDRSSERPSVERNLRQSPEAARPPRAPARPTTPNPEGERLSKVLADRNMASRREADDWIAAGWVKVDGQVAQLGQRVQPQARIEVDPAARDQQAQRVTILLHKPIGYVSGQAEDGYEPASVLVTAANHWAEDKARKPFRPGHGRGLAPAGRLDIDSTGLLVLTQDGRIAKHLIGEDSTVEKEYLVRVQYTRGEQMPESGLQLLCHGLELDGVKLKPAKVSWANEDQLRFVLREGRKRQIRRMCELVGLKVLALKRVRIGSVVLGKLPAGQWRYLRDDERF